MSYLQDILIQLGVWLRPYSSDIALALVASVLVVAGSDINKWIKKQCRNAHFIVRTLVFILICTFGYGALTVVFTRVLHLQLSTLPAAHFALVVLSAFISLGIWAQRKNQI